VRRLASGFATIGIKKFGLNAELDEMPFTRRPRCVICFARPLQFDL